MELSCFETQTGEWQRAENCCLEDSFQSMSRKQPPQNCYLYKNSCIEKNKSSRSKFQFLRNKFMQMPINLNNLLFQSDHTFLICNASACSHLNVIWRDRKGRLNISWLNGQAQPWRWLWETDTAACLAVQASQPGKAVCADKHRVKSSLIPQLSSLGALGFALH